MARTGIKLLVLLALIVAFAIAPQHAAAQCNIGYANGFTALTLPTLNNEGLRERPADIQISTGAVNCFSAGNTITVTYNGILSYPAALTNSSQPQYIVITNPNFAADGTLTLGVTTTTGISVSGPQTVIEMLVLGATTDPLATISLQNLRFDVNGLASAQLAPGTAMNSFVSGSAVGLTAVASEGVGLVLSTIRTGIPGMPTVTQGVGQQSSGGTLSATPPGAVFSFGTAPGWPVSAFRVANAAPKYPLGCVGVACTDTVDNPTTATSLVIDIESIPSGVTVTLPATLSIWGGGPGSNVPTWQWTLKTTSTNNSSGPAGTHGIQGIYETTTASAGSFNNFTIDTGATAADATPGTLVPAVAGTNATIGVAIGASSGSGTATLRVVFGPGGNPPGLVAAAAFAGDDFNASATAAPTYTPSISTSGVGREIITDTVINPVLGVDTAPTAYFTITPTQSAVLFQYATDRDGYQTGLAISNTGNDSTIFNTNGQTGPVIWYLFANGAAAPIIYQTKAGDGTGLDANGNLAPGNVLAITLDELLDASNNSALKTTFSGYVIALGQFQYGHGYDVIVSGAGSFTAQNALFLGSAFRADVNGALQ